MAKNGTTWTYNYDANGLRTSKSNGATTYTYVYNGSKLTQMSVNGTTVYFAYDANGHPDVMIQGQSVYHYVTNLRGDVIGIVSEAGQLVVSYEYDAWGNILEISGSMATTIGTLNPLTYRGYDHETELYYLQSRYYNPEWGRFLNMDSQINSDTGILGANVFAYCLNNPVVSVDADGYSPNDVFDSVDEAAIDAALYMEELGTFENAWEYAATIYSIIAYEKRVKVIRRDTLEGKIVIFFSRLCRKPIKRTITYYVAVVKYKYTPPNTFHMNNFVLPPMKCSQVAMIHSHPYLTMIGSNQFSEPDKWYAKLQGIPFYLYAANGTLKVYNPASNEVSVVYSNLPKDPNMP